MRQHFDSQPAFQLLPIERIVLPVRSRDELPPILAGLQWIWCHPALRNEIFQLLDHAILAGKKATGRPGMDLWRILVLGSVASMSFDKGFTRHADRELLSLVIPEVVMPRRGKKNAGETQREKQ